MPIEMKDFTVFMVARDEGTPINEIKWITGLKHTFEFDGRNFEEHAQLRDWCLENCSNKIVFVEAINYNYDREIKMYFYDEADAMACKLRWE